ncbi:hypothetical protein TRP8649_02959 [Pelagimonas phthalicica]|uniref:YdhG-like domain-containing protein n=1 Tax=Pelagimonas phthalicica TaxID=1037362 RepID=A0A238JFU2_9RHOB|nr:DUF1801 domain-containing protein [Pelagimonas phthalicica]TDS91784.1 uncharacterized protein DUF1801 [Pelagimonas phthalicica]SMX28832.1 hypothetical protein TRP8649_02959 [Pelagimonas phthalicica]
MAENKTVPTGASVAEYLATVMPDRRRSDALVLDALFQRTTGWQPQMWGPSIIGYGQYHYTYDSGRQGDFLATGFVPRKANMVVYIMPGYADFSDILARLGPHKLGKSCLYLGALSRIDLDVLAELITAGLQDLRRRWPIDAT